MCKTINLSIQQKRKRERIKIIVEGAVEILGIKEVMVDLIHKMLGSRI